MRANQLPSKHKQPRRLAQRLNLKRHLVVLLVTLVATVAVSILTPSLRLMDSWYTTNVIHKGGKSGWTSSYDDSGIPIVDYGEIAGASIGKKYNPVTVSNTALDYLDRYESGRENYLQLFLNCADWLVDSAVYRDGYAVLVYDYPWPLYDVPLGWVSGMGNGKAMEVLIKAHEMTGDQKYLMTAEALLQSFYVEVENGGVTYKTMQDGWWYEECAYPLGKESRILNGMMYATLSIYEYWKYTDSSQAEYLFQQGVIALEAGLSDYTMHDGGTFYDALGTYAALDYHDIHVELSGRLYDATGAAIFKQYHDKWQGYIEQVRAGTKTLYALTIFLVLFLASESLALVVVMRRRRRDKQAVVQKETSSPPVSQSTLEQPKNQV